jgi:murein DD-endopeptidase MepM/ murein hydrolase activator NlpD
MSEQGITPPDVQLGTQPEASPTPSAPEPSLRDQVKTAVKVVTEPDSEEAKAQRVRDEAGRFVRTDEAKPRDTLTLPADKAKALDPAVHQPAAAAVKPPEGWTAPMKAKFSTLDQEVQAEIIRRETDMHRQFTTQDQDRSLGKGIREVAGPYIATIRAEGGDEKKAFEAFLNYAQVMRGGNEFLKAQHLAVIMRDFNVSPQALYSILQGGNVQPGQSLQPIMSQDEVARIVKAKLAEERQNWEDAELNNSIEAFAADPAHEHFESVKTLMGALMTSGRADTMQKAYDLAINADPEISSTLAAARASEAESKRLTEAKAKTDAAKRAAGSVSGGPGGAKPSNGAGVERSLGEELRANFRAATGRV